MSASAAGDRIVRDSFYAASVNIEDLEWQADSYGGVNPQVVDSLLERGYLDVVVQAAVEREDWFCARGAVRDLQTVGDLERAWKVMRPFTETGWLPAVSVGADILLQAGRVEEALALVRPDGERREQGEACKVYAKVLMQAGQADAAIDALMPYLRDERLLSFLVEITEGQGHDERVLDLVTSLAEEARRMHASGQRESLGEPWTFRRKSLREPAGWTKPSRSLARMWPHTGPVQRSCVCPTRDSSRGTDASRTCARWPLAITSTQPSPLW